jgi:hypothetical protein
MSTYEEIGMKSTLVFAAAAILACGLSSSALAGPQQERMKMCNAEAKSKQLKGDERKAFMKECLSTKKHETTAKDPQQEKK